MNKRIQKGQRCKKSTTRRRNDIETSRALRHNDGLLRHNSRMTSSFELAYISNFFTYIVNCRKLVQQKKNLVDRKKQIMKIIEDKQLNFDRRQFRVASQ